MGESGEKGKFLAAELKKICLDTGADEAGFVDIGREALQKEREGILTVYPLTRSVISIIKVMNRENLQSTARYVASDEYHSVGDEFAKIGRGITARR